MPMTSATEVGVSSLAALAAADSVAEAVFVAAASEAAVSAEAVPAAGSET
jgi:hypothetical protein